MDYRINGTRKTMSKGTYPYVPLLAARGKRDDARRLIADGVDPVAKAKAEKETDRRSSQDTFKTLANDYIDHLKALGRAEATITKNEWCLHDLASTLAMTIPEHLTKMRRVHDIPLSRQARDIIKGLKPISGDGKYVFPSLRSPKKVISENGMNSALRRMGFTRGEHTSHGFRASASSILNRRKFHPDVIERSLAHLEPNKVRRAYNRYEYWDERIEIAQKWADICDELKARRRRNDDLV